MFLMNFTKCNKIFELTIFSCSQYYSILVIGEDHIS